MGAMPGAKAEDPTIAAKNAMVRSIVTRLRGSRARFDNWFL
jgi:hypothetical protein